MLTRGKPMKRTGPLRAKPKARRVVNPLKASTRSAVKKGPIRDKEFLARVRQWPCLVALKSKLPLFGRTTRCSCYGSVEAHHPHIFPNSAYGVKPSDHIAIPVCRGHHTYWPNDSAHGQSGESAFWEKHGIDVPAWIKDFSKEGAAAIDEITRYQEE